MTSGLLTTTCNSSRTGGQRADQGSGTCGPCSCRFGLQSLSISAPLQCFRSLVQFLQAKIADDVLLQSPSQIMASTPPLCKLACGRTTDNHTWECMQRDMGSLRPSAHAQPIAHALAQLTAYALQRDQPVHIHRTAGDLHMGRWMHTLVSTTLSWPCVEAGDRRRISLPFSNRMSVGIWWSKLLVEICIRMLPSLTIGPTAMQEAYTTET